MNDVLFQTTYGAFQQRHWWMGGLLCAIGIVGVPVGFLVNEGWAFGGHDLEPWAATLIIEVFAVGALMIFGFAVAVTWRCRKSPQRIAVTKRALIVPKGAFSSGELVLPFDKIRTTIFDVGFVKQLQIRHGHKKILLTSARFPANAEFDKLVRHLPKA